MSKTAKRVTVWFLLILAGVVLNRLIPGMVHDSIPSIYYITPTVRTYESIVACTGTLHPVTSRQVVLESTVVPREVFVQVGDRVNRGEVLATYQPAAALNFASALPQITVDSALIGTILSAYGLNSFLNQAGLNGDELAEFLLHQGRGQQPEVSVAMPDATEEIISPISGVITSVNITPFIPAGIGSAVFTVMDTRSYMVVAAVSESDIARISLGDTARIRGTAFPGAVYVGYVTKIYPTARRTLVGTSSETVVDVEILITNADDRLRPGFSARVEITGRNRYEIITVPYEAVRQDENNDEYVYIFEDGKLRKSLIITGRELTSEVEVLYGVTKTCIVIFNPDSVDREGTMIHLRGRANVH
jgi:multidrug efflux pump subunit AcrA (membrane-fusion protein)